MLFVLGCVGLVGLGVLFGDSYVFGGVVRGGGGCEGEGVVWGFCGSRMGDRCLWVVRVGGGGGFVGWRLFGVGVWGDL